MLVSPECNERTSVVLFYWSEIIPYKIHSSCAGELEGIRVQGIESVSMCFKV
jgi:hypothetical protein